MINYTENQLKTLTAIGDTVRLSIMVIVIITTIRSSFYKFLILRNTANIMIHYLTYSEQIIYCFSAIMRSSTKLRVIKMIVKIFPYQRFYLATHATLAKGII